MDSALIPFMAQNRAEGKPYVAEQVQKLVSAKAEVSFSDNGHLFLVGHPVDVEIKSDIGNYWLVYGDHEHKGNISIKNSSTQPQVITFIRITYK